MTNIVTERGAFINLPLLESSIERFQTSLFSAITTATYKEKSYPNGQKAKEAVIRSQSLIFQLHESVKVSLFNELTSRTRFDWQCFPAIGKSTPELKLHGKLKPKKQDIVFLREAMVKKQIVDGANSGELDLVGAKAFASSLVIGVRSQLSSIEKNRDTLMERAFAETLNLRLESPSVTMGEVYLLPLSELDSKAMERNEVRFVRRPVDVAKFIKTFDALSERASLGLDELYKYDASALLLVDFSCKPAKLVRNAEALGTLNFGEQVCKRFGKLQPEGFDQRLVDAYLRNNHLYRTTLNGSKHSKSALDPLTLPGLLDQQTIYPAVRTAR